MKLSTDYSPFGKFSKQILKITILGILTIGVITTVSGFFIQEYALLFLLLNIIPALFMKWGMDKQSKELGF